MLEAVAIDTPIGLLMNSSVEQMFTRRGRPPNEVRILRDLKPAAQFLHRFHLVTELLNRAQLVWRSVEINQLFAFTVFLDLFYVIPARSFPRQIFFAVLGRSLADRPRRLCPSLAQSSGSTAKNTLFREYWPGKYRRYAFRSAVQSTPIDHSPTYKVTLALPLPWGPAAFTGLTLPLGCALSPSASATTV